MPVHVELLGADLTEHHIKHGQVSLVQSPSPSPYFHTLFISKVGVSRAISALRPCIDTNTVEDIINVGLNPAHNFNLNMMKELQRRKKYRFSKVLMDMTKNRNFGINKHWNLFPHKGKKKVNSKQKKEKVFRQRNKFVFHVNIPKDDGKISKNPLPWVD